MLDICYLVLYHTFRAFFLYMPNFLSLNFLKILAKAFFKLDKKHTKIMRTNIKMCFDGLDEAQINDIILKTYNNFALFLREFIINQNTSKEEILKKISFENEEILLNALATNRPIIVSTAHYGNWELFSLAMAARFGAVSVIGRSLDSAKMNEILSKNRRRFDIELIEKNNAAKPVIAALKARRLLGILVDQNTAKKDGIECEFFGKRILHTPAASVFASKLDAIIIPAFIMRDNEHFKIVFFDQIDIKELEKSMDKQSAILRATQAQSDALMSQIKRKNDEYFWMHKKFKHFYEANYA